MRRLPEVTVTEREAFRGQSSEKHRKALSRLRINLPPPKEAIATIIESLKVYERFGHWLLATSFIILALTVVQLKLAPRWVHYEAEQK